MSAPGSYNKPGSTDLVNSPINMMIYGHPGEGKTVLWGSGREDVLFLKSDPEGTISATAQGFKFHEVLAEDYDDLNDIHDWLKGDKPDQFRWIVWDSLTLFQDRALIDDLMYEAVQMNPNQNQYVPSQREYLISMTRVADYVRRFCALPYNFGISAHVMQTTESGGDGLLFMPQIQGKNMPSKISAYMNVVGYMGKAATESGGVTQRIQFVRAGRYYAKDRWNALGDHVDKPTLPKIEALIEARRKQLLLPTTTSAPAKKAPAKRASAAARARASQQAAKATK